MKILIVGTLSSSILGFRRGLIKLLAENNEVYVLAMNYSELSKKSVRELGAVPLDYTLSRKGISPVSDLYSLLQLYKYCRTIKPDTVFGYFVKPVIYSSLAAHLAGVKKSIGMIEGLGIVFTENSSWSQKKRVVVRWIVSLLYKLSLPLLDKIIFLNQDDLSDISEEIGLKLHSSVVIGGIGVDLQHFSYLPTDINSKRFVFIGRLIPEKGVVELIDAFIKLSQIYQNVSLDIVGTQDHVSSSAALRNRLDACQSLSNVTLAGQINDVRPWIYKSLALVLPSYREGFPVSIQEAMACGRAVIACDVPGSRSAIENGVDGLLIRPFSTEALFDAMKKLTLNPELALKMGLNGRKTAIRSFDRKHTDTRLLHEILN